MRFFKAIGGLLPSGKGNDKPSESATPTGRPSNQQKLAALGGEVAAKSGVTGGVRQNLQTVQKQAGEVSLPEAVISSDAFEPIPSPQVAAILKAHCPILQVLSDAQLLELAGKCEQRVFRADSKTEQNFIAKEGEPILAYYVPITSGGYTVINGDEPQQVKNDGYGLSSLLGDEELMVGSTKAAVTVSLTELSDGEAKANRFRTVVITKSALEGLGPEALFKVQLEAFKKSASYLAGDTERKIQSGGRNVSHGIAGLAKIVDDLLGERALNLPTQENEYPHFVATDGSGLQEEIDEIKPPTEAGNWVGLVQSGTALAYSDGAVVNTMNILNGMEELICGASALTGQARTVVLRAKEGSKVQVKWYNIESIVKKLLESGQHELASRFLEVLFCMDLHRRQ